MNASDSLPAKATRDSWQNAPMPDARTLLSFERQFTPAEYQRLSLGLIPEDMDDRWFIFLEDDILYICRSWSGQCLYQLQFEAEGDNYRIKETWANRDETQYESSGDEYDIAVISGLIDNRLLA